MKYFNTIITCFLILILSNCNGQNKNLELAKEKYNYNKQIPKTRYYLDFNLFLSYEIYINDVKITHNIKSGPVSGMEYLNPFILSSGKQKIRLVDKDLKLNTNIPDDLFSKMKMKIFTSDENNRT